MKVRFTMYDFVQALIDYDEGTMSYEAYVELMQYLVDTGMAWQLQGRIGRDAADCIEQGIVKEKQA